VVLDQPVRNKDIIENFTVRRGRKDTYLLLRNPGFLTHAFLQYSGRSEVSGLQMFTSFGARGLRALETFHLSDVPELDQQS
jgi:hypothetical protein